MGLRLGRRSAKSSGRRARRRLLAEASPPELTVESWLLRPVRRRLSGPVVFTCGQTGGYVPATVLTREWRSNPGPVPTLTAFMGGAHDLLALELSHRITNIFAVISGVVTLSARGQPEMRPFARALQARMDALAAAHRCMRRTAPRWRRRRAGKPSGASCKRCSLRIGGRLMRRFQSKEMTPRSDCRRPARSR